MTHYQSSNPRAVFAIGAFALTALTIGLAVVVPAKMESGDRDVRALAVSTPMAPAADQAVTERLCIEVVGVRDPELISVQVPGARAKRKQDS
jgi:hypothetical protein